MFGIAGCLSVSARAVLELCHGRDCFAERKAAQFSLTCLIIVICVAVFIIAVVLASQIQREEIGMAICMGSLAASSLVSNMVVVKQFFTVESIRPCLPPDEKPQVKQ